MLCIMICDHRLPGGSFYVYGVNLENAKLMGIKAKRKSLNEYKLLSFFTSMSHLVH